MAIRLHHKDDAVEILLEGSIDIAVAADLKAALLEGLGSGKKLCVGLDGVTDLDVTAFQLLWALQREAQRLGLAVYLRGPLAETVRAGLSSLAMPDLAVSE